VISVAVKAIAVARGYVANEEGGCQVSFQPYLRQASSLQGLAMSNPQMLMGRFGDLSAAGQNSFSRRSAPVTSPSLSNLLSHGAGPMMQGANQTGPSSDENNYRAALIKSSENVDVDPSLASSADEHSELAFDVFKVPPGLLPPEPDDRNLPVKVTAHSRASVVSNIITKLVVERGSVVLITAGGRAMHVAMLAVVSARAKLRATLMSVGGGRGGGGVPDVLLIPKFVTVDTTSSLGWESVFLRFHIVAAPESLLGSELPQLQQLQQQQQANSQPCAIAIAAAAASARQQQQMALHNQLMMGAQEGIYSDRSLGGSPPLTASSQSLDTELLIRMMLNMNNTQQ
jgi:stage V sporulation protein SpoVS